MRMLCEKFVNFLGEKSENCVNFLIKKHKNCANFCSKNSANFTNFLNKNSAKSLNFNIKFTKISANFVNFLENQNKNFLKFTTFDFCVNFLGKSLNYKRNSVNFSNKNSVNSAIFSTQNLNSNKNLPQSLQTPQNSAKRTQK